MGGRGGSLQPAGVWSRLARWQADRARARRPAAGWPPPHKKVGDLMSPSAGPYEPFVRREVVRGFRSSSWVWYPVCHRLVEHELNRAQGGDVRAFLGGVAACWRGVWCCFNGGKLLWRRSSFHLSPLGDRCAGGVQYCTGTCSEPLVLTVVASAVAGEDQSPARFFPAARWFPLLGFFTFIPVHLYVADHFQYLGVSA